MVSEEPPPVRRAPRRPDAASRRLVGLQAALLAAAALTLGLKPAQLAARPQWDTIPAVQNGMLFEIKSPDILSPGPAAITEGLRQISDMVALWQAQQA